MTVKDLLTKEAAFPNKQPMTAKEIEEEKARKKASKARFLKTLGIVAGAGAVGAGGYSLGDNRGFIRGSDEGYQKGMDDLKDSLRNSLSTMSDDAQDAKGFIAKALLQKITEPISKFLGSTLDVNSNRLLDLRWADKNK